VKDKGESAKKLTVLGTTIGSPFYMAPEQAQGLDTLDHRADVWALAAIVYECVTGRVPFSGNNGPSILLEILTKEPKPPSEVGKGQKHPVPPTLDPVMSQAFKKMPVLRIPSVGTLADLIAQAYGLEGTHTFWAGVPEGEIAQRISANMPALMQPAPEAPKGPADAADDFFGESDALAVGMAPTPAMAAPAYAAPPGYAPSAAHAGGPPSSQLVPQGVPTKGPSPVLLLVVGGGALLLGAVVVVLFLLLG
jgi:serine/threonine protein kinase